MMTWKWFVFTPVLLERLLDLSLVPWQLYRSQDISKELGDKYSIQFAKRLTLRNIYSRALYPGVLDRTFKARWTVRI